MTLCMKMGNEGDWGLCFPIAVRNVVQELQIPDTE